MACIRHAIRRTSQILWRLAEAGCLAEPVQITVRQTADEEFDRIVGYRLSDKPEPREPGMDEDEPVPAAAWADYDDSEVPF